MMKINMDKESLQKAKVTIGRPSAVNFNFGVVGETGAGRRTFIKAFTEPYDFDHSDCQVHVVSDADLGSDALRIKHNTWLDGYKNPATDEQRNASDKRVHCIFYLFSPHRVLLEDKVRILGLQGLAPIVPVLAKADAMTPSEREVQLYAVQQMMIEISRESSLPVFFDFEEPDEAKNSFTPANGQAVSKESSFDDLQTDGEKMLQNIDDKLSDKHSDKLSDRSYEFPADLRATLSRSNSDATEDSFKPVHDPYDATLQNADSLPLSENQLQTCADTLLDPSWCGEIPRARNVFAVVCAANAAGLRVYPWGRVDTHDEAVSDLRRLQRLIFEKGSIGRLRALTQQMSIRQHAQNLAPKRRRHTTLALCPSDYLWLLALLCLVVLSCVFGFSVVGLVKGEPL